MHNGIISQRYVDNVYAMLKRRGLAQKYERPGIYSISIGSKLVYIGKSTNMLRRLAQHWVSIKVSDERKYRVMAEAQDQGWDINFDVLYYAKQSFKAKLTEELGSKEGELIRRRMPPLNQQIPKEENWKSYTINPKAQTVTLEEILGKGE